jgi:hypothetical protein
MTDNQGLVPNSVGLPDELMYNLKPSAASGRSYRASIQPTNKTTFQAGDTCIIQIPCGRRNCFLDTNQSYIKYTIVNNDTNNFINLDSNGACVINRLDVFHASNLLESIQQYNVLYTYLLDFTLNQSVKSSLSNIYGVSSTNRSGLKLDKGPSTNNKITVCMPVLSGVIGPMLDKMLPIHALNDDIRCEFTFETNNVAVQYDNANATKTAWSVTGVELELCYLELSDSAMSIINGVSPLNDTIFLHSTSWRHYVSSLASATAGTYSTLVPARFASTKTLVLCPRRTTEIVDVSAYSLSSRINPGIDQYWWRLGSALIPQKYVTLKSSTGLVAGYSEAFMEIQKSFHSLSHAELTGCITQAIYQTADVADASIGGSGIAAPNTATTSYNNAFAIAQELETYANKTDVLISGLNTLSAQTFFECNIGTGPTTSYTLDFYAQFDQILVKDQNGILSVRF